MWPLQAEQLLDAIPRLFQGSQASEAAAGAAITAAVAALKVWLCIGLGASAGTCTHAWCDIRLGQPWSALALATDVVPAISIRALGPQSRSPPHAFVTSEECLHV